MTRYLAIATLLLASCGTTKKPVESVGTPAPKPTGRVVCDGDKCRFVPDAPKVQPQSEGVTSRPFAPADVEPSRRERDPVVPRGPTHRLSSARVVDVEPAPMDEAPRIESKVPHGDDSGAPPWNGAAQPSDPCQPPRPEKCEAKAPLACVVVTWLLAAVVLGCLVVAVVSVVKSFKKGYKRAS